MRQMPDRKAIIVFFVTLGVILFGPILLTRVFNPHWPDPIYSAEVTVKPTEFAIEESGQ